MTYGTRCIRNYSITTGRNWTIKYLCGKQGQVTESECITHSTLAIERLEDDTQWLTDATRSVPFAQASLAGAGT